MLSRGGASWILWSRPDLLLSTSLSLQVPEVEIMEAFTVLWTKVDESNKDQIAAYLVL